VGDLGGIYIIADETWKHEAEATREALNLLGCGPMPPCLPGEPEYCGASFAMHAMAHFATLKAIADHQLEHLGPMFVAHAREIYEHELEALRGDRCQLHHPPGRE
jgi:hypothetical protein